MVSNRVVSPLGVNRPGETGYLVDKMKTFENRKTSNFPLIFLPFTAFEWQKQHFCCQTVFQTLGMAKMVLC